MSLSFSKTERTAQLLKADPFLPHFDYHTHHVSLQFDYSSVVHDIHKLLQANNNHSQDLHNAYYVLATILSNSPQPSEGGSASFSAFSNGKPEAQRR